jgi:hypothetical protein
MENITVYISQHVAILALVVSLGALLVGLSGYRLSKKTQAELKADEVLVAGYLDRPNLAEFDHANAVMWTRIVNLSRRKAYIHRVNAVSASGEPLECSWSNEIDPFGNPLNPAGIIPVVDETKLFIRRNSGDAILSAEVQVYHSFANEPLLLRYNLDDPWDKFAAKRSPTNRSK